MTYDADFTAEDAAALDEWLDRTHYANLEDFEETEEEYALRVALDLQANDEDYEVTDEELGF